MISKSMIKWSPPQGDYLKANADGAYKVGAKHSGWGVIIRDNNGQFVAVKGHRVDDIMDAAMSELKAIMEAINMALELGIGSLVVESDAQLLVYALNRKEGDASAGAVWLQETKMLMASQFCHCKIQFVHREANCAAHLLAQLGESLKDNSPMFWESSVPACIAEIVMGDLPTVI
uniref:RNase H type-1 domain-containing protein n=1 Tax=Arundo donax TaxID=35708 RepID=A0A0A9ABQ0_ARUDO